MVNEVLMPDHDIFDLKVHLQISTFRIIDIATTVNTGRIVKWDPCTR